MGNRLRKQFGVSVKPEILKELNDFCDKHGYARSRLIELILMKYIPLASAIADIQEDCEVSMGSHPRLLFSDKNSNEESTIPCLLYTSPSPRDKRQSRMPSSA